MSDHYQALEDLNDHFHRFGWRTDVVMIFDQLLGELVHEAGFTSYEDVDHTKDAGIYNQFTRKFKNEIEPERWLNLRLTERYGKYLIIDEFEYRFFDPE